MAQPQVQPLQQWEPDVANGIKALYDGWKNSGADDQGNPIDVEADQRLKKYRQKTEGYNDGNQFVPPTHVKIEGINLGAPLEIKQTNNTSPFKDIVTQAGGFTTGVAEVLNPLAIPRGIEVLTDIPVKLAMNPEVAQTSGLLAKISKAAELANKEAVIPSMSISDIAAGTRAVAQAPFSEESFSDLISQEQERQGAYNQETSGAQTLGGGVATVASLGAAGKDLLKLVGGKKLAGVAENVAAKNAFEATKPLGKYADKIIESGRAEEIGSQLLKDEIVDATASAKKMLDRTKAKISEYGKEIGYFVKQADNAVARDSALRGVSVENLANDIESSVIQPLIADPSTRQIATSVQTWIDNLKGVTKGGDLTFEQAQKFKSSLDKVKAQFKKTGDSLSRDAFQDVYSVLNKHIEDGVGAALKKAAPEIQNGFVEAKESFRNLKDAEKFLTERVARESKNRAISLTDMMAGGTGVIAGGGVAGLPGAIGGATLAGANKLARMKGSQAIAKTADAAAKTLARNLKKTDAAELIGLINSIQNGGQ